MQGLPAAWSSGWSSEAVVVPIQHIRWIFGTRPRVQGMKYHPIHGVYKLMDTWVS